MTLLANSSLSFVFVCGAITRSLNDRVGSLPGVTPRSGNLDLADRSSRRRQLWLSLARCRHGAPCLMRNCARSGAGVVRGKFRQVISWWIAVHDRFGRGRYSFSSEDQCCTVSQVQLYREFGRPVELLVGRKERHAKCKNGRTCFHRSTIDRLVYASCGLSLVVGCPGYLDYCC